MGVVLEFASHHIQKEDTVDGHVDQQNQQEKHEGEEVVPPDAVEDVVTVMVIRRDAVTAEVAVLGTRGLQDLIGIPCTSGK